MATIAGTVGSGTFNALAFTGFSFLFRSLDRDNYLKEVKRHNLALEKFNEAKEKWYENEVEKKNEIQRLRQQLADANADISVTNTALKNLRTIEYDGRKFTREPHFTDFYKPSQKMKEYAIVTAGLASTFLGWGAYKLLV